MADELRTKSVLDLPLADTFESTDVTVGVVGGRVVRVPKSLVQPAVTAITGYDLSFFGAKGDGSDDSEALISAIQTNNSSAKGIVLRLGSARYRITSDMPAIVKPMVIEGSGVAESNLFFDGCNGLTFNLSSLPAGASGCEFRSFSLTTNRSDKTGLVLVGQTTDAPGLKFILDNVLLCPNSRYIGGASDNSEWSQALVIGSPTVKTAEVNITDLSIFGSPLNDLYATRTSSVAIRAYAPTGLRIDRPKIVRCGTGIAITGQCEGTIIDGGTIFGVDLGITFTGLVNPSNNHIITNTHVSAYTKGISVQTPAVVADLALSNFISKCFILERESGTNKSTEYVAIELMSRFSVVSDTVIWSNTTTGTHERVGVRLSPNANRCIGLTFNGSKYPFDVVSIAGATEGGSSYADDITVINAFTLIDKSANANFVYTNCILSTVGANGLNYQAASLRFRRTNGLRLFDVNSSGLTLGDTDSVNTGIAMKSATGSGGFDTRLISIGGSTGSTSGQGDLQLTAVSARLNATILRPETDGLTDLGSATFRFKSLYATGGTFTDPVRPGQFTLTTLPNAAAFNGYEIDVTNATGGSKRCRSNGTVWQILNTTTTVS